MFLSFWMIKFIKKLIRTVNMCEHVFIKAKPVVKLSLLSVRVLIHQKEQKPGDTFDSQGILFKHINIKSCKDTILDMW